MLNMMKQKHGFAIDPKITFGPGKGIDAATSRKYNINHVYMSRLYGLASNIFVTINSGVTNCKISRPHNCDIEKLSRIIEVNPKQAST